MYSARNADEGQRGFLRLQYRLSRLPNDKHKTRTKSDFRLLRRDGSDTQKQTRYAKQELPQSPSAP